jgi:peptide/nickel transport system permease protein
VDSRRSSFRRLLRSFDGQAALAVTAILLLAFVALFGARIAPNEPIYFVVEHGRDPRPFDPGVVFPFGSDVLGRDLFSLVLAGARATLEIVLLAGVARTVAGVLIAAVASWWRPTRLLTESVADFAAAVPATLVAVLLIKAFVKSDTSVPVVIGALLLVGWAGPYRVVRTEIDRLTRVPFIEGARTMGATRWRLFWRHQLPHLLPVITTNLSQQVVASLVLVAELGVLGVIVSPVRSISVEESLSRVIVGPPQSAPVPDTPEWGAMLSTARTTEILWATRWVIFVPGAAFAATAMAVAVIGYALARRYARRDVFKDVPRVALLAGALAVMFVISQLVPERYAEAREWAASARGSIGRFPDTKSAFAQAGLSTYAVERRTSTIVRTGPAAVTVDGTTMRELFPQPDIPAEQARETAILPPIHLRSLVSQGLGGGGIVDGPVVFASRGIVPADLPQTPAYARQHLGAASLGAILKAYPDDYAGIDVRGKIVLLLRFAGVDGGSRGRVEGFSPGTAIQNAIDRGASGVIFVDPEVARPGNSLYPRSLLALNAYVALERQYPPLSVSGAPVIVVDESAAQRLFPRLASEIDALVQYDPLGMEWQRSASRDLATTARIEVPLAEEVTSTTSLIGEVPGFTDDMGRVVVWIDDKTGLDETIANRRDVIGSLARFASTRHSPFIFVDFDPSGDARAVRDFLLTRRVLVVIVLDQVDRQTLGFTTANGDLIPAFDLYAEKAGASFRPTRVTANIDQVGSPVPDLKTVMIGAIGDRADVRGDAAALIGYLAGRLALGAPELGR